MKYREFLERYVYVRTCVGCGERMGYDHRDEAFCDGCRISWERAKAMSCPNCLQSMADCRCIPKSLSGAGVLEFRKLVAYMGEYANRPENKLLYFLKRRKSKRVALFAANQLLYRVDELLFENKVSREDAVLVFIPRSRRASLKFGVDQAKLVCEMLSDVSGIKCLPLIKRKKDGKKEQKALGVRGRMKNARNLFEIDERYIAQCRAKSVILFDDIVTSGASMAVSAKLLRGEKTENIYGLAIAYSVKEKR